MTDKRLSSIRGKIRSLLVQFLSELAHDYGYNVASSSADSRPRTEAAGMPRPDLVWLKGKSVFLSFYILPARGHTRFLKGHSDAIRRMIVCVDSDGNTGLLRLERFLQFLEGKRPKAAVDELQALANELPASRETSNAHFTATVVENREIVSDHFSLKVRADYVQSPVPGQFLQIMCDPAPHMNSRRYHSTLYSQKSLPNLKGIELLERRPFLRRPFSIASYHSAGEGTDLAGPAQQFLRLVCWQRSEFEIIYKRIPGGPGTSSLAKYRTGEKIDIVGPLGKGFFLHTIPKIALLVGGGIGAPPLLFLAQELKRATCDVKMFLGAMTKERLPFRLEGANGEEVSRFKEMGLRPVVCTDDGSAGSRALVTEPLVEYLEGHGAEISKMKMFACGPRPLLSALNGIADRFRLPCDVLLEERMACGIGACISCVCAIKEPGQRAHFTRICVEGPAFDVKKVMWHA